MNTSGLSGYFHSQANLWAWVEDGQALALGEAFDSDSRVTLAFAAELQRTVERLTRWPNFHSLVAVFVFYRSPKLLHDFIRYQTSGLDPNAVDPFVKEMLAWLQDDSRAGRRLHSVPEEVRRSTDFKIEYLTRICEQLPPVLNLPQSKSAYSLLCDRILPDQSTHQLSNSGWTLKEIRDLLLTIRRVDPVEVASQLATGLSTIPDSAPVDPPTFRQTRQYIQSLENDPELAGVAAVAHSLLSLTTLPRKLLSRSQSELGGFSDLTNRGTLDRLMVSELAHDDLTLAVRIAMNEAMYLQREQPHSQQRKQQIVLLHTGIRTWGLPRIYAIATALAFSVCNEEQVDIHCYRAQQAECKNVDLHDTVSLINHLRHFNVELHPAHALPAFRSILESYSGTTEPLLVLEESEFADPEFQKAWLEAFEGDTYVATVTAEGDFHLLKFNRSGVETIRKTTIPLQEIVSSADKKQLEDRPEEELPAIFSLPSFPLRLSHAAQESSFCRTSFGLLSASNDRRLMLNETKNKGGIELVRCLPPGNVSILFDLRTHVAAVICQQRETLHILFCKSATDIDEPVRYQLPGPVTGKFIHNSILAIKSDDQLHCLARQSGEWHVSACSTEWINHRFFYHPTNRLWFAWSNAAAEGGRMVPISLPGLVPMLKGMIEHPATDGQIGIGHNGILVNTLTEEIKQLDSGSMHGTISYSADGSRALVPAEHPYSHLLDSSKPLGASERLYPLQKKTEILEQVSDSYMFKGLRNKLKGIAVSDDQRLLLLAPKGNQLQILLKSQQIVLQELTADEKVKLDSWIPFNSMKSTFGFDLHVAQQESTKSGRIRVFLDSRGLLHFKSGTTEIPEITIIFKTGATSGWLETGEVFGDTYFYADSSIVITPEEAFQQALAPFIEALSD